MASTLISEYAPARIRGRVVVALEAFWAAGYILAALIGFLVVPQDADGWRWALAIGALPALYAVVVHRGLPESVRFLERRGRLAEAEEAVRRFEASAGVPPPAAATGPVAALAAPAAEPEPVPGPGALWSAGFRCARSRCGWCGSASTSPTTAPSSGCPRCWSPLATTSSGPSATR